MGFDQSFTNYLFARPSFFEGFSRTFDIAGGFDAYNVSTSPEQADILATWHDWKTIGQDLQSAIQQYGEKI